VAITCAPGAAGKQEKCWSDIKKIKNKKKRNLKWHIPRKSVEYQMLFCTKILEIRDTFNLAKNSENFETGTHGTEISW